MKVGNLSRELDSGTYEGRHAIRAFAYALLIDEDGDEFANELLGLVGKEG